jgi:hypothetical protein
MMDGVMIPLHGVNKCRERGPTGPKSRGHDDWPPPELELGRTRLDSVLSLSNGNGTSDQWRSIGRSMMEFWSREMATPLGDAFMAWYAARTTTCRRSPNPFHGDLPQEFSDIRIPPSDTAFRPLEAASFHADVRDPNPLNFVLAERGAPAVRIGALTDALTQRALVSDLVICRGLRYPAYQQVDRTTGGRCLSYMRLLLPVADKTGTVNRIYAYCRPLAGDMELLRKQMVAAT